MCGDPAARCGYQPGNAVCRERRAEIALRLEARGRAHLRKTWRRCSSLEAVHCLVPKSQKANQPKIPFFFFWMKPPPFSANVEDQSQD